MRGARSPRSLAVLIVVALAVLSSCSGVYENYAYTKEYDPRKHEYIIGVGDSVSIQVYHSSDLGGSGTVRPDGIISMPLVGDILVAGKTPSQVRELMRAKLATFVKNDTVINVTVTGFNSYRFVISGNVNKSGANSQKYYVTVSEAIAIAGGLNKFAGDRIIIMRLDEKRHIREIPISYKRITSGKYPHEDICVVAGDTLIVE